MDESIIRELERVTDGRMKLSEAIRIGRPMISRESQGSYRMCALGCVWAAYKGQQMTDLEEWELCNSPKMGHAYVAEALGLSRKLCEVISGMHEYGQMPALAIADWLESRGH